MDDKTDDKTQVIRHNIEETRSSLTEKLEKVEQSVVGTVQNTTSAVTETVGTVKDAVQGTVDAVKDTVASTVQTVKDTVQGTVDTVKDSLNLRRHVENYPWAMFGGSVAAGYLVGYLTTPSTEPPSAEPNGQAAWESPEYNQETDGRARSNGARRETAAQPPAREPGPASQPHRWLWNLFSGEFDKIRKIAIGTGLGFVREMIEKNVEGDLAQKLTELVDDFNSKLGGEAIRGPFFKGHSEGDSGAHASGSERQMAGAMM